MRYSPEHKAATRMRVLKSAGKLAKQNGFGTTGVDALMAEAGLTAGAFYAHFSSKSELLEALIEQEVTHSLNQFEASTAASFNQAVDAYLSPGHIKNPGLGCVLPALTAEVARAEAPVRETFELLLLKIKDRIATQVESDDQAWSVLAQLVGAVLLARAMPSKQSRKALLDGVRRSVLDQ